MAHGMFLNLLLESGSSSDEDDEDLLLECEISNSLFCKQKKAKLKNLYRVTQDHCPVLIFYRLPVFVCYKLLKDNIFKHFYSFIAYHKNLIIFAVQYNSCRLKSHKCRKQKTFNLLYPNTIWSRTRKDQIVPVQSRDRGHALGARTNLARSKCEFHTSWHGASASLPNSLLVFLANMVPYNKGQV